MAKVQRLNALTQYGASGAHIQATFDFKGDLSQIERSSAWVEESGEWRRRDQELIIQKWRLVSNWQEVSLISNQQINSSEHEMTLDSIPTGLFNSTHQR